MPRCRKFSQRKRRGERKPDVKKCNGGDGSNCESKSKCQTLKKAASVFTTYSRENRQSNLHKENGDCTEIDIYYLENQNTAPSNDGFQDLLQQTTSPAAAVSDSHRTNIQSLIIYQDSPEIKALTQLVVPDNIISNNQQTLDRKDNASISDKNGISSVPNEHLIDTQPELHMKEKTLAKVELDQFSMPYKNGIPPIIMPSKNATGLTKKKYTRKNVRVKTIESSVSAPLEMAKRKKNEPAVEKVISLSNENVIETQPELHVKEKTVTHIVVTQFNVPCKGGIPSTILPAKQGPRKSLTKKHVKKTRHNTSTVTNETTLTQLNVALHKAAPRINNAVGLTKEHVITIQPEVQLIKVEPETYEASFLHAFDLAPVSERQFDSFDALAFFSNDAIVQSHTGIENLENLWMLYRFLEDRMEQQSDNSSSTSLPLFEQFCLTLMTLRLDLHPQDLRVLFKLPDSEMSMYIDRFLSFMTKFLVPFHILWLKREDVVHPLFLGMEIANQDFQKCVCFVDFIQVQIDRNEEYLNYVIAFSSTGLVSFVSDGFPGNQKDLLKLSGLLKHLSHDERFLIKAAQFDITNPKLEIFICDQMSPHSPLLIYKPLNLGKILNNALYVRVQNVTDAFKNRFLFLTNLLTTSLQQPSSLSLFDFNSPGSVDRLIKVCCALYNASALPSTA